MKCILINVQWNLPIANTIGTGQLFELHKEVSYIRDILVHSSMRGWDSRQCPHKKVSIELI